MPRNVLLVAAAVVALAAALPVCPVRGDTLEFANGDVMKNCYIRDEGVRIRVWPELASVGGPLQVYPRSRIKSYKIERGPEWDLRPELPDLTVTHIEITPKLAGLHGRVDYDKFGRPSIGGAPALVELRDRAFTNPEEAVRNLKLRYEPGEEITFVAHVKNVGFAPSEWFEYAWEIDDKPIANGLYELSVQQMREVMLSQKWSWEPGKHTVTFRIRPAEQEIATVNNVLKEALWAWPFTFVVSTGRVNAWHQFRSAYGTFSFEDFYRWHVEIMNTLFEASRFPAAPDGIQARVRLDRIIYADKVVDNIPYVDSQPVPLVAPDGIRYDQGGWTWNDSPEELKTGTWTQVDPEWRNQTEWSLPHELGHQLGLTDWYTMDDGGTTDHLWPDNGDKVAHFMTHPEQMMHSHGPQVYGEADAGYLNFTWDKPRGHFGDHHFAIPRENFLRIVDINGRGVPGAKVEVFQRGVVVDATGTPGADQGVQFFAVIEDGEFGKPMSKLPVIVGRTDADGVLRLPNRPVMGVKTLNGFERKPNPFGNINVVGERGLMLVRVSRDDAAASRPSIADVAPAARPCYFYLEIHNFVTAWFRGQKERYVTTLPTPYGSPDSPPAPHDVRVQRLDEMRVKVTWQPPDVRIERQYLQRPIGYRVWRRCSSDGLNDRPWFAVATLGPAARECIIDLGDRPEDVYWFSKAERFGVTTLGELSVQSELSEALLK